MPSSEGFSFTVDLRFIEIKYELAALAAHLKLIEDNLPVLQELEMSSAWEDLRLKGWDSDPAEVSIMMDEVTDRVERVYPRFFRSSFLVVLWALFEQAAEDIGDYSVRPSIGNGLPRLRNFRGRRQEGFVAKVERYYCEVLGRPLPVSDEDIERLNRLRQIRNRIAHSNGRAITDKHRGQMREWADLNIGVRVESAVIMHLDPKKEYVASTFGVVERSLKQMMNDAN